jgi:hypothetical protein
VKGMGSFPVRAFATFEEVCLTQRRQGAKKGVGLL